MVKGKFSINQFVLWFQKISSPSSLSWLDKFEWWWRLDSICQPSLGSLSRRLRLFPALSNLISFLVRIFVFLPAWATRHYYAIIRPLDHHFTNEHRRHSKWLASISISETFAFILILSSSFVLSVRHHCFFPNFHSKWRHCVHTTIPSLYLSLHPSTYQSFFFGSFFLLHFVNISYFNKISLPD